MNAPFSASSFPAPVAPASSRCLPLSPCGLGTALQESLPSYLNRSAALHRLPAVTFFSQELVPLVNAATGYSPVANYLGKGSRYLLLGDGLTARVAGHLATLTAVPEVNRLVHPYLTDALGWTRDLRQHAAWCSQCFAEWHQAGQPLYFPLLWAFRAARCCLRHNVVLRDNCPYCWRSHAHLTHYAWEGKCLSCGQPLWEPAPVSLPSQSELDATRLVEGLLQWSSSLSAPSDILSVLLRNIAAAADAVGGGKPLSAAIGRSPAVVGFWLRRCQTPTLESLLRLSFVFGVPLEAWLSTAMKPQQFASPAPLPVGVPWLSQRVPPVPAADVEDFLRYEIDHPTQPPPSLAALSRSIPVSISHVHHVFPDLAAILVARHRVYAAERKVAYAQELAALVGGAIAQMKDLGLPVTPDRVLAHLGGRWPLSRRQLRDVFSKVSRASTS